MTLVQHQPNLNSLWATLIVEELCRLGCHFFVLSPGSRSTPLTAAVARNEKAKSIMCFDERSSAFYALGLAQATQKPVAVIVTSGTAVANLMPAIMEASLSHVPLIILTADRPFELRQVSANQTVDQVKIFGTYVRDFIDMPAPDDRIFARVLLGVVDQLFLKSMSPLSGPVHINCMFREPLEPDVVQEYDATCLSGLQKWQTHDKPLTCHWRHRFCLEETQLSKIANFLNSVERGVIVVGEVKNVEALPFILQLAHRLQWPILVEATSGLRFFQDPLVIHYVDHLLLHPCYMEKELDVVIQFGGKLISKRLQQFLEKQNQKPYFLVDDHFERVDPYFTVTDRVYADAGIFCQQMVSQITAEKLANSWVEDWQKGTKALEELFSQLLGGSDELSEPYVARAISKSDWSSRALFLSSSMPIRDMNMFAAPGKTAPCVGVNRGASGIDGIVSTASGFAAGLSKPVTLLIGDLAFLHDSNGLSFLANVLVPMTIVLINNQGGGIFSFLPIVKTTDIFSRFFDTPHKYALEGLSHTFAIKHTKVTTIAEFDLAYDQALTSKKHCIIEVMSHTALNWKQHECLRKKAIEQLQNCH